MAWMDGIVEIDAGEDGKHVRLQECDQQLQSGERDDQCQWQRGADHADDSGPPEQGDETCEHLQRDVSRQHIGEQTHAVRNRSRQERQQLDEYDQGEDIERDALGHEQVEEVQPMLPKAVSQDGEEDRQREGRRYDDVSGDREGIWNKADDVHGQNEHEKREHEGEEAHAFAAGRASYGIGDKLVRQFCRRLQAVRHQASFGGAANKKYRDHGYGRDHIGRRIGEGDLGIADLRNRKQLADLELVDWIDRHDYRSFNSLSRTTPAARITFSTPAAKPSNRNTMSPHGEIPSQRSSNHPIAAPTSTPATSSVDNRKPRAIAEGSVV